MSTNYTDLLDIIYGAPLDDENWEQLMLKIKSLFPYTRSSFAFYDEKLQFVASNTLNDFAESIDQYQKHYASVNPWIQINTVTPVGAILRSSDFIPTRDLRKTEFFNDWLKHYDGVDEGVGSVVVREPDRLALLGIHYDSRRREESDVAELVHFLKFLTPHLQRAVLLQRKIEGLQVHADQLETMLDNLEAAFLIVDRNGTVRFANASASDLLAEQNEIFLAGKDRLSLRDTNLDDHVRQALKSVTGTILSGDDTPPAMPIRVPTEGGPILVAIAPLSQRLDRTAITRRSFAGGMRLALVCLSRAELGPRDQEQFLVPSLGITQAEARLAAAVYAGKTLYEYADEASISRNTARNQMQSILSKTGCRRQADLVRQIGDVFRALAFRG